MEKSRDYGVESRDCRLEELEIREALEALDTRDARYTREGKRNRESRFWNLRETAHAGRNSDSNEMSFRHAGFNTP